MLGLNFAVMIVVCSEVSLEIITMSDVRQQNMSISLCKILRIVFLH